ncbi:hypothetical protein BpHYR1_007103 [Brachionus plicatilis]|uniref:Uncharacterized protein n=1 Tax=Brachionus plicatilis TaxID=10195 RepID=A0A3M7SEQ2_BRAPC|nr:hypothetical protein BpHYR1_007103 [Brachionus plicatilis]
MCKSQILSLIGKLKNKKKSDLQITLIIYANNLTWHEVKDNEKKWIKCSNPIGVFTSPKKDSFFRTCSKAFQRNKPLNFFVEITLFVQK